jgi:hypothetical protein
MWADNETDVDLLGFDYLVDELELLLRNERLLPLTVLVSGDWGSGKSSLMEVARKRLEAEQEKFICVKFTPWRFEDIGYGKVALMAAVVDAIADYADEHTSLVKDAVAKANKLRTTLQRWGIWKNAAAVGAAAAGLGPEEVTAIAAAADAAAGIGAGEEAPPRREFETVAHFHSEFADLVESLGEQLQAVVVFIDDMDRCSSETTIVETFEAMRLFLNAPKTAYVVGAHESIVEAALDRRYEGRREGDENLGGHWLEKMLQHSIAVPPLGEPEVLSYINLLFCELHTSAEKFAELRARADQNRKANPFQVAMNTGIARDVIGEVSAELAADLDIALQIGPVLAQHARGNPRETKRFLNRFLLRLATAHKRGMSVEADKLAKLMVLERLMDQQHFERVFVWHTEADTGAPEQLALAEQYARGEKDKKDVPDAVQEWVAQPRVAGWLRAEPALGGTNLAPYFTFSRDRLARLITAPKLSQEQQKLLGDLQNDVDPVRVNAVKAVVDLDDAARADLIPAMLNAAERDLNGDAAKSLREVAARRPEVATAMFDWLGKLPKSKWRGTFALRLATELKHDPRTRPLLEKWADRGNTDVKRQATRALAAL